MKSDRHEARIALSCSALGFCAAGAVGTAADAADLDSRDAPDRRTAGAIGAGGGCELSSTGAVPAGEDEDEEPDDDADEDAGAGDDTASDCTVF